ncbi:hypothetical protein [Actinoplanes couchii]|uniref:Secreted protein n=1 Tax=Actinoplanes couchii TaxID=403638 RepID=A0ABQ3XEU4_9ACTN|nr:hypothetical protein [Actinoplanes couchii]MDR6319872.1 hypothetical protein [Actinoplanes couchii]GID57007.1 hypothetical protein Aco03nite_054110 [Actinoplanes couchii]
MYTRVKASLAALVVGVGLVAFPAAAQAAQNNYVAGTTDGDTSWVLYSTVRHDVDGTTVTFKPDRLPPGGLCLMLFNVRTGNYYGHAPCWGAGDYTAKNVATNVATNTDFRIRAKQRTQQGSTNPWSGTMRY